MKKQVIVLTTLTLFGAGSMAFAHNTNWKDRVGSNSLSDEPRDPDSPAEITMPPNGFPSSAMSTSVSDSGGNAFLARTNFDRAEREYQRNANRRRHARHDWVDKNEVNSDEMVYRSAAPMRSGAYFASYGEDLPALRGLQLEVALNRLHHLNRKEIDMAKMGESRAKTASVLTLAHQIRADHEKLENKVVALAKRRNINLESFQLSTYEQAIRDRLDNLSGAPFESAFLRVMERGHEEASTQLRMVRNDLADTEVRGLINEALPQIAAHKHNASTNKARASVDEGDLGE